MWKWKRILIIVPDKVSEVLYEQKNVLVVKTLSSLSLTHIEDLNHIDKNVLILSKQEFVISLLLWLFILSCHYSICICICCHCLYSFISSNFKLGKQGKKRLSYSGLYWCRKSSEKTLLKKQLFLLYFVPVVPATLVNLFLFPVMTGSIVNDVNGVLQIASIISGIQQTVLTVCLLLVVYFSTMWQHIWSTREQLYLKMIIDNF